MMRLSGTRALTPRQIWRSNPELKGIKQDVVGMMERRNNLTPASGSYKRTQRLMSGLGIPVTSHEAKVLHTEEFYQAMYKDVGKNETPEEYKKRIGLALQSMFKPGSKRRAMAEALTENFMSLFEQEVAADKAKAVNTYGINIIFD